MRSHSWTGKHSCSARSQGLGAGEHSNPAAVSKSKLNGHSCCGEEAAQCHLEHSSESAPVGCSAPCDLGACEPAPRVLQNSVTDFQPRVTLCRRRLLRVCGCALQRRRPRRACGRSPASGSLPLCGSLQSALCTGSPSGVPWDSILQSHMLRVSGLPGYSMQELWCFEGVGVSSSSR